MDPTAPHMLYFSRLDGHVGRTDTRAPNTTDVFQLSEKKIGGFSLNPSNPHFIATASLDRYLRIWDLRKLSGKASRQLPALIGEHESRLSVSHAAFNSAGQVATASYDDTVKIHTFDGMGSWSPGHKVSDDEMEPTSIVRHNNQTGRWVTMSVGSKPPSTSFLFLPASASKNTLLNRPQSPRPVATPPAQLDPPLLHRQHEPLRRHLHRRGRAAGAAGRRRHHRRSRRGPVPPHGAMGRGGDGEREAVLVDVTSFLEFIRR